LGLIAHGLDNGSPPDGRDGLARALSRSDPARLAARVTLLHCTTEYPAPAGEANLNAMATLAGAFGLPVGFSDHTDGIAVAIAAAGLGAAVIEKHLTLDRDLPGPDHKASLVPADFAAMVTGIRLAAMARGDGRKAPTASEWQNRPIARRRLVAARDLAAGDVPSLGDFLPQRPAEGRSPMDVFDLIGKPLSRSYKAGEPLD